MVHLEVDPRGGGRLVYTFAAVVRNARFRPPPFVRRECDRGVLRTPSTYGVRARRIRYNSERGHRRHHY